MEEIGSFFLLLALIFFIFISSLMVRLIDFRCFMLTTAPLLFAIDPPHRNDFRSQLPAAKNGPDFLRWAFPS